MVSSTASCDPALPVSASTRPLRLFVTNTPGGCWKIQTADLAGATLAKTKQVQACDGLEVGPPIVGGRF